MLSERLLRLLTAYVDGEVSAHQRKVVLRTLQTSPEARTLLKKLQDDASTLRQLPVHRPGLDLSQKIMAQIGNQVVRPVRVSVPQVPSPIPRGFGLATAAAVLLALGFGSYYYLKSTSEKDPELVVDPIKQAETPRVASTKAEEKSAEVSLPDQNPDLPKVIPTHENKSEVLPLPKIVDNDASKKKAADGMLASPVTPPDHFQVADVKVAMTMTSRDLTLENPRLKLLERLVADQAQHIDLYCKQTRVGLSRLERAFKEQGIQFVLAPDAVRPYLLGKGNTDYLLFTENVKPDEVLSILRLVAEQDRMMESIRKGAGQFQTVLVNRVSEDDHKLLGKVLGIDPTQLQIKKPVTTPKPVAPLGIDIRKPIASGTANDVIRNMKGQGGVLRPEPKSASKPPKRLIVVGTCNPVHPAPKSDEVKLFLDSRKERQEGTFQMLLVLRQNKK